jgi:hypothetical protein
MRIRLIAFLPIATLISILLLSSASSLVSAVERAWIPHSTDLLPIMRVRQFETECEELFREIHALSHETTRCDESPECLDSPLLCRSAMDVEIEREFQRLRTALNERCGLPLRLMDYAWGDGEWASREGRETSSGGFERKHGTSCGASHDWLEATTSGNVEATRFLF